MQRNRQRDNKGSKRKDGVGIIPSRDYLLNKLLNLGI